MGVCDVREKKKDTSQKMNEKTVCELKKNLRKKRFAPKKIYIKMSSCDNTLQLMND